MDSVRFGRVLGVGARIAGKTLVEAVDAATSPDPTTRGTERRAGDGARLAPPVAVLPPRGATGAQAVRQARAASEGVRRGGRRFGEAMWGPVARASGVLWLEVTGVFFGLIALLGIQGMWANRAALHWPHAAHEVRLHFAIAVGMAVIFGYFGTSSFVRATRRSRLAH